MPREIDNHEQLYQAFEELSAEGGWHRKQPALWPEPRKTFIPWAWHYRDIKPVLAAAGRLVDSEHAERRNLTLRNPREGTAYATVNTLVAAYQMIQPGEVAKAHRHTPAALRLILEGEGTYTVVNGTRIAMHPGDVLLTPSWCWHAHACDGDETCYWMDFLDVPLVHLLEPMFFERHPQGFEQHVVTDDDAAGVFHWVDSRARLDAATPGCLPDADRVIQLGDPALATIALYMHEFAAGSSSARMRTTANSIFAVVQGAGETQIDGERFAWRFGDTLAIPAWRPYQHRATTDAVLLRVTDEPLLSKLNWLRAEVLPTR